jgi:hypothetical protein
VVRNWRKTFHELCKGGLRLSSMSRGSVGEHLEAMPREPANNTVDRHLSLTIRFNGAYCQLPQYSLRGAVYIGTAIQHSDIDFGV